MSNSGGFFVLVAQQLPSLFGFDITSRLVITKTR